MTSWWITQRLVGGVVMATATISGFAVLLGWIREVAVLVAKRNGVAEVVGQLTAALHGAGVRATVIQRADAPFGCAPSM